MPKGMLEFATDASQWGGGGLFESEQVVRKWVRSEGLFHINLLECIMILDMMLHFGEKMAGVRVVAWCNNMVSVRAVNKGVGGSDLMNSIIWRLLLVCLERLVALYMCHIPGTINLSPDTIGGLL